MKSYSDPGLLNKEQHPTKQFNESLKTTNPIPFPSLVDLCFFAYKQMDKPAESTKGLLYEIKHKGEIVGHLLGTMHEMDLEYLTRIDERIISSFDSSSHLFLEITDCSETNKENKVTIRGIDSYLHNRAHAQSKKVKGLETEKTRAEIDAKIKEEEEYYMLKLRFIMHTYMHNMLTYYHKIAADMGPGANIETIGTIMDSLMDLLPFIFEIIKNQKYLADEDKMTLVVIMSEVSKLLEVLGSGLNTSFGEGNFLLKAYQAQVNRDENYAKSSKDREKVHLKEMTERYAYGGLEKYEFSKRKDISHLQGLISQLDEELNEKSLQARNVVMANTIDEDLKQTVALKGNRLGFYTAGARHLFEKLPDNLLALLRQKGWQVDKVDLRQVVTPKKQLSSKGNSL